MKTLESFLKNYYVNNMMENKNILEAEHPEAGDDTENDDTSEKNKEVEDKKEENDVEDIKEDDPKNYFFKNILFFTNDRREEKNKTLKNLLDAVKGTDIEVLPFVAEEVSYKAKDNKIEFNDKKNKYIIDKQSNIDTIVIVRLGAQDSEECMELIKELQDWGLFVINPIQFAKRASNKYTSSVLLERYEVPQPRFALLQKVDIEEGEESLKNKLKLAQ